MQILMIVSSGAPEIRWNAFRLANLCLNEGDDVTMFLHGPAVDYAAGDCARFPLAEQAKLFTLSEGALLA